MGYFSNSTEQMMYDAAYCNKCAHAEDCPIMSLHWLWNYDQCGKDDAAKEKKNILDMFISQDSSGYNEKCKMFVKLA